jgi:hypothetical protein
MKVIPDWAYLMKVIPDWAYLMKVIPERVVCTKFDIYFFHNKKKGLISSPLRINVLFFVIINTIFFLIICVLGESNLPLSSRFYDSIFELFR